MNHKLFVYGTLRGRNSFSEVLNFVKVDTVKGTLINLGAYPGYIPGDETITGEIMEIINPEGNNGLKILDNYEGYYESDPEASLYVREYITTDSGEKVYIYRFNTKRLNPNRKVHKIISGDWYERMPIEEINVPT